VIAWGVACIVQIHRISFLSLSLQIWH